MYNRKLYINVLIKMAKKGTRVVVTLECTEARTSTDPKRSNGISRYTTEKNRRNTTERLELKKFNPHLNRMTIHKEIKYSNQIMPNSIFKKQLSPIKPGDPIDYKDVELLKKFITERGKILPRRMTGLTSKQQRDLTLAVKRARIVALLPFVNPEG